MTDRELIGHMYLAKRPCGRVVAAAWDDPKCVADTAKSVAKWMRRGNTIERVARHRGEAQPEWVCGSDKPCACRDAGDQT